MANESITNAQVRVTLNATLVNTETVASPTFIEALSNALNYTNGTAANQANVLTAIKGLTINSGSSQEIDLSAFSTTDAGAGTGVDPLGVANTWLELVAIVVVSESTSAGNLTVGGTATTGSETFTSIWHATGNGIVVQPGGMFMLATPAYPAYTITPSTNYILHNSASGGNVTYDLYLIGRNA
jgi:hypothetical protein